MKRSRVTESIINALNGLPFKTETWLYGSEARGSAHADSDIDLLILVDSVNTETENDIIKVLYPIELSTGILINPLVVAKSQWSSTISPFYLNVTNERVRLW
ncbi:MAG: nucleotidyltransferase domain-containing protein [Bacteroidales bacterium]|nr:nucleotidyltransferase domain-containing protein [Bacteroidales bacterium]